MVEIATTICLESDIRRALVGAVITKGGRVLAASANRRRNMSGTTRREGLSYCAEQSAIRSCGNPEGATIYVVRTTKKRRLLMAQPCKRCRRAIVKAGIRKVIYTDWDGTVRAIKPTVEWTKGED